MSVLVLPLILLLLLPFVRLIWVFISLIWESERHRKSILDADLLVGSPELADNLPPLASDIHAWLDLDFAEEDRAEANQILRMSELGERCQRCALHLAEGELPKLRQAVKLGLFDWRELITAAEYDGGIRGMFKQARDFSKPQTILRSPAPNPESADRES